MFRLLRRSAILLSLVVLSASLLAQDRFLNGMLCHEEGDVRLRMTNYGVIGACSNEVPGLEYPAGSGVNYLGYGALWFGAKKYRLNEVGQRLFWLTFPPTDPDEIVAQGEPGWTSELVPVIDTLTTVGYDGDGDLYECLPAYNPLEQSTLGALYTAWNLTDTLMRSVGLLPEVDDDSDGLVDEDPLGKPWQYPDPDETYCFTMQWDDDQDGLFDEDGVAPGYETMLGFSYDFSPFETPGQRDWGGRRTSNDHVPLQIAIRQESYVFPYEGYEQMVFLWFTITNLNPNEALYDYCAAWFINPSIDTCDLFASGTDEIVAAWDVSSSGGLAPDYLGLGLIESPGESIHWTWVRGDGPDDEDPLDITPNGPTANEKYWLMTGLNPDPDDIFSLPVQQPLDGDIRFLTGYHGDQQGIDNPSDESLILEPNESVTFKTVLVMGASPDELLTLYASACDLAASGFDYDLFDVDPDAIPAHPATLSCYPNPFNPETKLRFTLAHPEQSRLDIYNLRGQRVATLVDEYLQAGEHTVIWTATDCASGVYFCRLDTGDDTLVEKMLLLK
ncbi:MAG: T9SS type A sorting domain-containing protein [Candidatus Cloacimonetes bacterium]|nr:T9SS type A sorting domain-containing protein [Candidatus Cloacimonadota bacterium]